MHVRARDVADLEGLRRALGFESWSVYGFSYGGYFRFVGQDIDWSVGGEVARLPDFRPRLKELSMPVLIVAGRYDRALYPKLQRDFVRAAPQARFVMMEKSGSFAHIEEPETLFALLREFLAR